MGGGDTLSKYIRNVSLKEENKRTNLCVRGQLEEGK